MPSVPNMVTIALGRTRFPVIPNVKQIEQKLLELLCQRMGPKGLPACVLRKFTPLLAPLTSANVNSNDGK